MRTLILALTLTLSCTAFAQQGETNPRNAAMWYQRAIVQYLALPESQRELLANGFDPAAGPPSPEMRMALANVQGVFQNIQRGSMQESADFGLDCEQGFELRLPHLGPLRQITKAARTDAMVRVLDGDSSGAAERLSSLYRMAGHGSDDRILISSLVGQAIFSAANDAVQFGADHGSFNAADSARLLNAVKTLGTNDPFQYLECVASEQEVAVNWLSRKFDEAETPEQFAQYLATFDGDHPQWQELAHDEDGFNDALDQYDTVMTRVAEAFADPDAEAAKAALNEIAGELERGEHGPLAAVMVPSFSKLLESKLKGEKMLAERIAMLEGLVSGQVKPEEAANAALWYLRGVERLATLEPAQLAAIRNAADSSAPVTSDELAAALDSQAVRDMMELFDEASQKKRCDFKAATHREQTTFIPAYAPGMNDALRVLRLDAIRQLGRMSDDGRTQALARIALSLRVIGHFGSDPMLASALVGHNNFISLARLFTDMLKAESLAEPERAMLAAVMERISRRDPFGYVEAVVQTRKAFTDMLRRRSPTDEVHKARLAHSAKLIDGFNGDQLLMIACTYDVYFRASKANETGQAPPAESEFMPAAMADVMSVDAAATVRAGAAQMAPSLAMDNWTGFVDGPLTIIATPSVVDRMRRARADVRDLAAVLRPVQDGKAETATE